MDREEILRKAQNENNDEMEVQIRDKSSLVITIIMVVVFVVSTIRFFMGH